MTKRIALITAAIIAGGCVNQHKAGSATTKPAPTTQSAESSEPVTVASASPKPAPPPPVQPTPTVAAAKPVDTLHDVVPTKPFFSGMDFPDAKPSILLQQHARTDSPVPLSRYAKQPTHKLEDFGLSKSLTAAALEKKLGPPAQIADYAEPWVVYRMPGQKELWLHFAADDSGLLEADVVSPWEDGYRRERAFGPS